MLRKSVLIDFAILTLVRLNQFAITLEIEAEQCIHSSGSEIKLRGGASGEMTLLLRTNQFLTQNFTTNAKCYAAATNVTYSNDGGGDTVVTSLDGKPLASFTTGASTGIDPWNTFLSTGPIGQELQISAGTHQFRLEVTQADSQGVEIDKVTLTLDCGSTREPDDDDGEDEGESEEDGEEKDRDSGGITIGEILGVIAALLAPILAVLVAIVLKTLISRRRRNREANMLLVEHNKTQKNISASNMVFCCA